MCLVYVEDWLEQYQCQCYACSAYCESRCSDKLSTKFKGYIEKVVYSDQQAFS